MRVEGSSTLSDQGTVNLVRKAVSVEKLQVEDSSKSNRASSQIVAEDEKSSQKADIAKKSLADLLKEEGYDISFQLSFSIHKDTKQLVVKVIDPDTDRVIREIPPEELLELAVRLQEMLGLLVDKRV